MSEWVVSRRASLLSGDPSWALLSVAVGEATDHATFRDEQLARRVADLLTRNGMVDAPLSEEAVS